MGDYGLLRLCQAATAQTWQVSGAPAWCRLGHFVWAELDLPGHPHAVNHSVMDWLVHRNRLCALHSFVYRGCLGGAWPARRR